MVRPKKSDFKFVKLLQELQETETSPFSAADGAFLHALIAFVYRYVRQHDRKPKKHTIQRLSRPMRTVDLLK